MQPAWYRNRLFESAWVLVASSRCFACCCVTVIDKKFSSHFLSSSGNDSCRKSFVHRVERVGGRTLHLETNLSQYPGQIYSRTFFQYFLCSCLYRSSSSSCVGYGTSEIEELEAGVATVLPSSILSCIIFLFFTNLITDALMECHIPQDLLPHPWAAMSQRDVLNLLLQSS